MPSWVAGTVGDVGRRLRPAVVDDTHPGVRLLHNLDRPLLEQLDPGSGHRAPACRVGHIRKGRFALWAVAYLTGCRPVGTVEDDGRTASWLWRHPRAERLESRQVVRRVAADAARGRAFGAVAAWVADWSWCWCR